MGINKEQLSFPHTIKTDHFSVNLYDMYIGLGEDFSIMSRYVGLFCSLSKERFIEIEHCFKVQDNERLRVLFHSFKGSISNLYCLELVDYSKKMEQMVGEKTCESEYFIFKSLILILINELDKVF